MATLNISGTGTRNNTGRIVGGGAVTSSRWNSLTLKNIIDTSDSYGSNLLPSGLQQGIAYSINSGTKNTLVAGYYVGPYITKSKLAGLTNTAVDKPTTADVPKYKFKSVSARRINITNWNYLTGAATKGGNAGVAYNQVAASGGGTVDDTLQLPGELVYRTGKPSPVRDTYEARTSL